MYNIMIYIRVAYPVPDNFQWVTRIEATVALKMKDDHAGRDAKLFALHSGGIGGVTQMTAQGMSELQFQRAGR